MVPQLAWVGLAVAFGVCCGLIVFVLYPVGEAWNRRRHGRRVYDWSRDGECDNRSHPRILDD